MSTQLKFEAFRNRDEQYQEWVHQMGGWVTPEEQAAYEEMEFDSDYVASA